MMMPYKLPIHISSSPEYLVNFIDSFTAAEFLTDKLLKRHIFVISDSNVAKLHLERLLSILEPSGVDNYILPAGESSKCMQSIDKIVSKLIQLGYAKDTLLIAFGGGMVGDITGMCASLYQRGVEYIQIPTTLLAQIDSSIGGKTAVNHILGKNMLGTIYPPSAVFIKPDLLLTLSDREFNSALGEAIKYGLLFDQDFFNWLQDNMVLILRRDAEIVSYLIYKCLEYKAECVSCDEFEQHNQRILLNLGHTLGHALEQATNYAVWLHGEAVAIGIVFASYLSFMLGYLSRDKLDMIVDIIQRAKLPTTINQELAHKKLMQLMQRDKKNYNQKFRLILLKDIGKPVIEENTPVEKIESALNWSLGK